MSKPVKSPAGAAVTFLDGRTLRLSAGEVNAINRMAWMNGTDPESVQYDPGHVRYTTVNSLVDKGVLVREADHLPRFAAGMLPVVGPTIHAQEAFDLHRVLAEARKEADQPEPTIQYARALGENQRSVLVSLNQHGVWRNFSPDWVWGNTSSTTRIMEALARRGLVSAERPDWDQTGRVTEYRITGAGRRVLEED